MSQVIYIVMPPLRSMREDIALLARHFLEQFARELGKRRIGLTSEAMQRLENYDWPGNVRELVHEMKRLVVLARGPAVAEAELSLEIRQAGKPTVHMSNSLPTEMSLKGAVEELEQHMLQEALVASGYNQVQAARRLGLSRQGLIKKLKRYGITTRAGRT